MENDEDLYLKAHKELKSKDKKEAIWIKALTLCKGDTKAAEYEYINLRVIDFKNNGNQNISDEIINLNFKNNNQVLNSKNLNTKVMNNEQNIEPGKFRYIQAWVIASLISNILISIIMGYFQPKLSLYEEEIYKIILPFLQSFIILLVWLGVVNIKYYNKLKISKLSFWMLTLGSLGVLGNLYTTIMLSKLYGNYEGSLPQLILSFTVYFAMIGIFYWYGKKKNRV